jgi:hypothetical protein
MKFILRISCWKTPLNKKVNIRNIKSPLTGGFKEEEKG